MKWQPIETAPTDGTRILLRGRNGKIADGHYGQPDGWANPKRFVWPYINATPTHWAPLALIDAAPELLAAARKVNALSIQTDAHKELRAAISKATGTADAAPECTCAATGSAEFLAGGARYKISGGSIRGLPRELDGRWVALVAADDDCHL